MVEQLTSRKNRLKVSLSQQGAEPSCVSLQEPFLTTERLTIHPANGGEVAKSENHVQNGDQKRTTRVVFDHVRSIEPEVEEPLTMYLREIGERELITGEREVELAKAIEAGNLAADDLRRSIVLSEYKRVEYEEAIRAADRARKELTEANLRLVVSVARRYTNRGLPLTDLIQEGNIGLLRAVEKFDYRRGFRFSTYATWWIRQSVSRAISDHARIIRLPVYIGETLNKFSHTQAQITQELGREPSLREITQAMGISVEKVAELLEIAKNPTSLDEPIREDEESYVCDIVPDSRAVFEDDIERDVVNQEAMKYVRAQLTPRESRVLELRYGLEDGIPHTLDEVGDELGVTRERVRQIEVKAIRKLQHPSRMRKLKELRPH